MVEPPVGKRAHRRWVRENIEPLPIPENPEDFRGEYTRNGVFSIQSLLPDPDVNVHIAPNPAERADTGRKNPGFISKPCAAPTGGRPRYTEEQRAVADLILRTKQAIYDQKRAEHLEALRKARLAVLSVEINPEEMKRLLTLEPEALTIELLSKVEQIRIGAMSADKPDFRAALATVQTTATLLQTYHKDIDSRPKKLWLTAAAETTAEPVKSSEPTTVEVGKSSGPSRDVVSGEIPDPGVVCSQHESPEAVGPSQEPYQGFDPGFRMPTPMRPPPPPPPEVEPAPESEPYRGFDPGFRTPTPMLPPPTKPPMTDTHTALEELGESLEDPMLNTIRALEATLGRSLTSEELDELGIGAEPEPSKEPAADAGAAAAAVFADLAAVAHATRSCPACGAVGKLVPGDFFQGVQYMACTACGRRKVCR